MKKEHFWILLCVTLPVSICMALGPFPTVSPVEKTFRVEDVKKADVSLEIESPEGSPIYRLQCHSAGFTGDPDFDYSGDFECRLSSVGHNDRYSTLLTEDISQSRDWESRGRFFSKNIRGACASIPDFGATRTFQLRGMTLILQIVNPSFNSDGSLKAVDLRVAVSPDPGAKRPIAAIVPPPRRAPAECKLKQNFIDPASFGAKGRGEK